MNYEVYFLHADKHWILSFWVSVTRHAQSTQNKFAYLCNISIKAWGMKLSFCLQINTKVFYQIVVSVISQTGPKYQKQSVYNLCNISRKTWRMMLQVFSNWYYHFRCIWPGMSKLPKITSLLFLYNAWKLASNWY